jgi:tripartite-type tricarboxylate transporter receptor subunit TctC
MDRRELIQAWATGIFAACLGSQSTIAQNLSGRTLRFLVGYPVGGVADFIARASTEGLGASTGATVVVENRPGAAGNIAMEAVSRGTPDGSLLGMFGNLQVTMNPHVPQLSLKGVDPMRTLVPVIALADMILMLAVSPQFGVKTLDQFLAKAKEQGPKVRLGLAGIGTPHHLTALLLQKHAGLDMTLVPYKGGPPMMADAAGGHLDAVFTTLPVGGPMVAAGKLQWIATVPATPIASLPGLPALAPVLNGETVPTGNTVFAPAGTPSAVLVELHDALRKLLDTPALSARLRANGLEPLNIPRQALAQHLRDESAYMKDFLAKVKIDFST